jgi:hypothetical protein
MKKSFLRLLFLNSEQVSKKGLNLLISNLPLYKAEDCKLIYFLVHQTPLVGFSVIDDLVFELDDLVFESKSDNPLCFNVSLRPSLPSLFRLNFRGNVDRSAPESNFGKSAF